MLSRYSCNHSCNHGSFTKLKNMIAVFQCVTFFTYFEASVEPRDLLSHILIKIHILLISFNFVTQPYL